MLSFIPGMSEFGKEEKVKRLKTNPEEEVDVLRRISKQCRPGRTPESDKMSFSATQA